MLDVDHLKWSSGAGDGPASAAAAAAASLLADVEDTMEDMAIEDAAMLFDLEDDWLHEHNLDVLFDLFEEELEGSKTTDATLSPLLEQQQQLGSSPITSYLFGSAASSLASALDLYDLLYFDATQQQQQQQQQPSTSTPQAASSNTAPSSQAVSTVSPNAKPAQTSDARQQCQRSSTTTNSGSSSSSSSSCRQSTSGSNSLNVMRIKRRLKRGQSEGVSLLARPGRVNNHSISRNHIIKTSDKNNNNSSNNTSITNSSSKKLSTTSTNSTNGIDINNKRQHQTQRNRHLYHYHQHVHYITACSVIREHAYAAIRHPTIHI